jgi:DNA-binding NarL/FixJ family response regulator
LNGKRYLSPEIAQQLQSDGEDDQLRSSHDLVNLLTDRELEIFELIGKGRDVREISKSLNVSPKTVETHRTNIKEKLKLKNSRQVARVALQWFTQHPS